MMDKRLNFDKEELDKLMDEFGDNISTLADALGVSRQNISQVMNGQHSFTYQQIVQIAAHYKMDAEAFFRVFVIPYMELLKTA